MSSCYPVLMTTDVGSAADFFRDHFGFTTSFETDWYVSLDSEGGELAVLDPAHPSIPDGFGTPVAGLLVNLEVPDVDDVYRRLVVEGSLEAVLELRSEAFGQRHFIVRGPAGSLVDVITEIEPVGDFAAAFS